MKILVADRRADALETLGHWLEEAGHSVLTAPDGAEAWRALGAEELPSIVVLDAELEDPDLRELTAEIRRRTTARYVPVVAVLPPERADDVGRSIEADAYLLRPVTRESLRTVFRTARQIRGVHEDLARARETLRVQATHDPLTGLWNRTAILGVLRRELSRSGRERTPLAALVVDIDGFVALNDDAGHAAGDTVLREVGRRLRGCVRPYDSLGRYGADEFLAVLPGCDAERVRVVGERMLDAIRRDQDRYRCRVEITAAAGAGVWFGQGRPDPVELVREAGENVRDASSAGGDRLTVPLSPEPEPRPVTDAISGAEPVVNLRLLEETTSDLGEMRELILAFLGSARERLQGLREAMQDGDQVAFRAHTHALKGICSQMGADGLLELIEDLDKVRLPASEHDARHLFGVLVDQFKLVARRLDRETTGS